MQTRLPSAPNDDTLASSISHLKECFDLHHIGGPREHRNAVADLKLIVCGGNPHLLFALDRTDSNVRW